MGSWTCNSVHYFPRAVGILLALGLVTVFTIAVLLKHVSPYVPFISETGANPPESGIFSLFLDIIATLGFIIIILRYAIVSECIQNFGKWINIVNKLSLIIGFISMMGIITVAAYPMISVMAAHITGAMAFFLGSILYGLLQTLISYKMYPVYNSICICHTRLVLCFLSALAYITMSAVGPSAMKRFKPKDDHWTGDKTPEDQGFDLLVVAATSEWAMCLLFFAFFLTFVREFSKVSIELNVRRLVNHFDEIPSDANSSEQTLPQ